MQESMILLVVLTMTVGPRRERTMQTWDVLYRHKGDPTVYVVDRLTAEEANAVARMFRSPEYKRAGYYSVAINETLPGTVTQ